MGELKLCPFCGGEAKLSEFGGPQYLAECYSCEAGTLIGRTTKEEAIEDWNMRPPEQDCAPEMYELLERFEALMDSSVDEYHYDKELHETAIQLLAKARGEG